jgi:hypothetical protein
MTRSHFKTASTAATAAAPAIRAGFTLILCALAAAACTNSERRQENENTAVKNELSREVQRICALPVSQRQGEIDRVLRDSGLVIVCPER